MMYQKGEGVPKDDDEAEEWFMLSEGYEDDELLQKLDMDRIIKQLLPP
jgi:TPR repeat protein